jgi:cytochrome c peroxidase
MKSLGILSVSLLLSLLFTSCGPEPPPIIIGGDPGQQDTTLFRVSGEMPPVSWPSDNPLTREGFELGRRLFFDPFLSGDGTQSCGSCHVAEFGFTDNDKQFSEGIRGELGNRNSMPTFNLLWNASFFWDSRAETLRQLALMPIENPLEMDEDIGRLVIRLNEHDKYPNWFKSAFGIDTIKSEYIAKAIEQFLLTMVSDNSKFDKFNRGEVTLSDQEQKGFDKLKVKGCFNCHSTSLFHDNKSHNTGLDAVVKDQGLGGHTGNSSDYGKFKTPSLRNIMLTAPYMHDGRFANIDEVLKFYDEEVHINGQNVNGETRDFLAIGMRNRLQPFEVDEVKAFLNTLTDHELINDPRFKDPFE